MGLALAPQCCCGFPGFFRWGANYGFVDLSRVDVNSCSENWAPWMVSCWDTLGDYLGCSFSYVPAMGNAIYYDLLGYDSYHDRVYLANAPGNPWYWNLGNEPSEGGVSYFILANVTNCLVTLVEAISDEDGQAILDGSDPTADSPTTIQHYWSDYSNGRIYGFTRWYSESGGDDYDNFKAWSVLTDGTDYTEHFTVTVDSSDGNGAPNFMCVADGAVYTAEVHWTGTESVYRFRLDGSSVADMHGGSIVSGIITYGVTPGPVMGVDNQIFALSVGDASVTGREIWPTIILVEDDATVTSQRLQFVADEDGEDVEYYPLRIGWDERLRAGVILWGIWNTGFGSVDIGKYVTYHTRALEPGNILTQLDHVKVYACLPFGGDFYGNCSYGFGVVIPGRMPPPLTVEGRVITPPVPAPPDPEPCDTLDSCSGLTATATMQFFPELDTVVDGVGSDGYGGSFDGRTIYYGNFARDYDLELVASAPAGPCSGGGPSTTYALYVNVSDGYYDDYNHPGILLATWEYSDPSVHRELYVTDILFGVDCVDGALQLKYIMVGVQVWTGTTPWPPTGAASSWSCFLALGDGNTLDNIHSGYVDSTGCAASLIQSLFKFTDWFAATAGDYICGVDIQIG